MTDFDTLRKDFPVLGETMHGKPLVYLDSAATSLKPLQVVQAEMEYYTKIGASIHRGLYPLSEKATDLYEEARAKTAKFINAKSSEVVFVPNGATYAVNLAAYSWGRKFIGKGDAILLTEMEHHANLLPWQALADETGAALKFIPVDRKTGKLRLETLDELLTGEVKLVAVSAMSNVTGVINPVREIADAAHRNGSLILVDGAQSVSHMPTDVAAMDCDFLAFSSHKMLGPTGLGVLYAKEAILKEMPPFITGGSMIVKVYKDRAIFRDPPERFEPGTPNIAGAIGFSAALDYLEAAGMDNIHARELELLKYAYEKLDAIEGVEIFGTREEDSRGGIVSFRVDDVHPHDVGEIMSHEGVAIRVGQHCCHPLMQTLDIPGTARASLYLYNRKEDIDGLVRGIYRVKEVFGGHR